jgi:NADPH2:quinone reductase
VPGGLTDIEAASLPETFFTVWSNVFDRALLGAGEGGERNAAGAGRLERDRRDGHPDRACARFRVFATAGTADKCRACEALGAERAINYKTEDFVEVVKSLTHDRGVDVILDMVGAAYLPRELSALADGGRIVLIALLGGAKAEINLGEILRRR